MTVEKEHEHIQKLLPWYVNDTLAGKEAEAVLRHLSGCEACRDERDRLYQIQQLVQETEMPTRGYLKSFGEVMQRVETADRDSRSMREVEECARHRSFFPMGLAAAVLLAVVATGAVLQDGWDETRGQESAGEAFQTLSSDAPAMGASQRIELGFVNPIPATTLRQALIETDSSIVSGPDASGNYLVEVTVPGHISSADYLSQIQKIEGVERARYIED